MSTRQRSTAAREGRVHPDAIPWKALCTLWLVWGACTAAILLVAWMLP